MRRVVVTGMGIVSPIGCNRHEVADALRAGRTGLRYSEEYRELGLRSQVHGPIALDTDALIDRKLKRFMGEGVAYNYLALREAVEDAGLTPEEISNPRTGLVMGSGGTSTSNLVQAADTLRSRGVRRIGPYGVTRIMSSTNSAVLATAFQIQGVSYSISSACATSAHCIGHAAELIQFGKQDRMFAGGGEEVHWSLTMLFDAMGALSTKYNATPERASRPFDTDRDGFVISGGGGALVLEALEVARARGARIYAELVGYGATSDGYDMVAPSGEGAVRCMRQALEGVDHVDYVNAHGTGTPVGDVKELEALRTVFGDRVPPISSTKSMTGHALGAAGVHEVIYSLIMQQEGFIAPTLNLEHPDPAAEGLPLVRERVDGADLRTVMSNSFGFGGANATLVFRRFED